jgi:hypothetical protein
MRKDWAGEIARALSQRAEQQPCYACGKHPSHYRDRLGVRPEEAGQAGSGGDIGLRGRGSRDGQVPPREAKRAAHDGPLWPNLLA